MKITEIAERSTVRLISTGNLKKSILAPLARNHGDMAALAELEGATNGRLGAAQGALAGLDPKELVYGAYGYTFVNAAFTHTRPGGSRFNGEDRGAWYASLDVETALAEVTFHATRDLDDIGRYETHIDYVELLADFIGPFHDLRGVDPAPASLHPDVTLGYPAGQALAKDILAANGNGIVYPAVRRLGGTCLAAFRPALVQNVRQGALWRVEWQGSRHPTITKDPK